MTKWIDRINRTILRRISPSSNSTADSNGIQLGTGARHQYTDLRRVVAFRQAGFVGDAMSLALDFGADQVIVLNESDTGWSQVLSALDADPRTRIPSREWLVTLVATPHAEVEVLEHPTEPPRRS